MPGPWPSRAPRGTAQRYLWPAFGGVDRPRSHGPDAAIGAGPASTLARVNPADLIPVAPEVAELGALFAAAGRELHLVGGTVRDALLHRPSEDVDLTTDAPPEEALRLLKPAATAVWTVGIEFGTVGGQLRGPAGGRRVEITTYRADRYDRVSRNPAVAFGTSLSDDLRRRDFTMNAMALSVPGRVFTDPYGGLADLARGLLRTPGPPEESFADDPLRMLRAARFVAQLSGPGMRLELDDTARAAIVAMAGQLGRITAERVQAELTKLLLAEDPVRGLELLTDTGMADAVLPELPALRMTADEHGQHKDVYAHTLQVLRQAIEIEEAGPDLTLRWAAVLHDVGKPATRRFEGAGRVSFHHHEVVGARLAKARLKELRYPRHLVEDVARLVYLHLRFYGYGDAAWTDSAVRRYVTDAGPLLHRLNMLVRSDVTTRNRRRALTLNAACDDLEERIAALRAKEQLDAIRPDLDGNQIMAVLGIGPGPTVGKAYRYLLERRIERGPVDPAAAVAELIEWAGREGLLTP
jgi:poly(A) polymerase